MLVIGCSQSCLWNLENIPRIEPTHQVVALHAAVHDRRVSLFRDSLLCNFGINPVRKPPHLFRNLSKLNGPRSIVGDPLFELIVKVIIIKKNVGVVKPPIEVALDRSNGLNDPVKLLVPRQDDKGGVRSRLRGIRFDTAGLEDAVVLFAYFPVEAVLAYPGLSFFM